MYLILDIGSNSIRSMQINERGVFQKKRLITTRLASGLDQTGMLSGAAMERSVAAIEAFIKEAACTQDKVFAYATSAVRDAANREDFLRRVYTACGISVDVLSGEEEARNALLGARAEGLVDIGGGSAQIVTAGFAQSWPMGCVRAAERNTREAIEARCRALFRFPRLFVPRWAGAGGTLTTLSALHLGLTAYDSNKVGKDSLTVSDIEALIENLTGMGEARAAHPLLHMRHDVIIPGAIVACFIMRGMNIPRIFITDADGMEGYAFSKRLVKSL
ncbi:MAG: hypothetical protein PHC80_05065 [Eubacteriales bacterium]|nr:hypothetical protein [Eubacteriales bacterium]